MAMTLPSRPPRKPSITYQITLYVSRTHCLQSNYYLTSRSHLGSIGALVAVAAMSLDPSFQQTVTYHIEELIDSSNQAGAATTHSYNTGISFDGEVETSCK
jgi:hypothetical protein